MGGKRRRGTERSKGRRDRRWGGGEVEGKGEGEREERRGRLRGRREKRGGGRRGRGKSERRRSQTIRG